MSSEQENQLLNLIIQALDKLDAKIDQIKEKHENLDVTMAVNTESLKEHVKRTNLLEKRLERDVEPALKFYNGIIFIGKVLGLLAIVATMIGAFIEVITFFTKR